jgi:hypothetical protein
VGIRAAVVFAFGKASKASGVPIVISNILTGEKHNQQLARRIEASGQVDSVACGNGISSA